ncbi:MAG TPA: flavohemoglobin expression-modulating QEGLA motif protein, partial [Oligoflexia bacterium]|nr:flavohemoglobin expression-modulating QEGLA motif protein [Oligoflexia bacterium]
IKWAPSFDEELRKSKFKDIPKVDADYYESLPLGFDPEKKITEFEEIIADAKSQVGVEDELARMMIQNCEEYKNVVHMLENRGTKKFYDYAKILYGSPKETFRDEKTTINDLARVMYDILSILDDAVLGPVYPEDLSAEDVIKKLNKRFENYFVDNPVRAKLSDGIVADAAAGSDSVKIREGALFSQRDVDILEVHEGWVHVGTTLNGQNQHICRFLSKGPPRVAPTQEGLAILMEIFSFVSYPRRARTINDRVLGIDKCEDGANILELLEFYRTEGYSEEDCINNAKRVFRGGVLTGGAPFTKDIAYIKGFIENYNFMRAAMKAGKPEYIPYLFVGKIHSSDVPVWYHKHQEGIVDPPKYLPPQFKDLNGVAVWMSFSNVFNMIDMKKVQEYFSKIF